MRAIFTVALFLPLAALSQVGIGTSSPSASAKLQVDATDKGFLPPRVNLTGTADVSTIASPATGLLVYNLATANTGAAAVSPGYYYYDGTKWQRVVSPDGSETLTNKSISGSANTITNVSLTSGVTGTLPIANGGTGQTTANAALNALLPSQTGNADKVLVTNGTNTSWNTNVALTSAVIGTRGSGAAEIGQNTYTGASITLAPGKWSINVSMLAVTSSSGTYWLRTGFSESSTSITLGADGVAGAPVLVSGYVRGGGFYTMMTGTIIIHNQTAGNKTYYYCTGTHGLWESASSSATFTNLGRDSFGENCIVAFPMN